MSVLEKFADRGEVDKMRRYLLGMHKFGEDLEQFREILMYGYKNSANNGMAYFNQFSDHTDKTAVDILDSVFEDSKQYERLSNGSTVLEVLQKT